MLVFTRNAADDIINWDCSYTQVRNHSGRTVAPEGRHNDYENASGLGTVHYHHGVSPHLHPMGACPYKKSDASLIDLFRSYQAVIFTATKVADGYTKYVFEAAITLEPNKKYFTLEITGGYDEGFYLVSDEKKTLKEKFRGTGLAVERVSRDDSPWTGMQGGLYYMVNAEYFKNMIERYCGSPYEQDGAVWLRNLENDISLGLGDPKKRTLLAIANALIEHRFEVAFIAGVLGNIKNEAELGVFENSNYETNPGSEPDYLRYMDEHYNYLKEYANENITTKSLSVIWDMLLQLEPNSWRDIDTNSRRGFGLGCIQWTFARTKTLFELYKEMANGSDTITIDQVAVAEGIMLAKELTEAEEYKGIYLNWKSDNQSDLDSSDAAYKAGYVICRDYEKPDNLSEKAPHRAEDSQKIYAVMKGR